MNLAEPLLHQAKEAPDKLALVARVDPSAFAVSRRSPIAWHSDTVRRAWAVATWSWCFSPSASRFIRPSSRCSVWVPRRSYRIPRPGLAE